jgi:hypothetical protein
MKIAGSSSPPPRQGPRGRVGVGSALVLVAAFLLPLPPFPRAAATAQASGSEAGAAAWTSAVGAASIGRATVSAPPTEEGSAPCCRDPGPAPGPFVDSHSRTGGRSPLQGRRVGAGGASESSGFDRKRKLPSLRQPSFDGPGATGPSQRCSLGIAARSVPPRPLSRGGGGGGQFPVDISLPYAPLVSLMLASRERPLILTFLWPAEQSQVGHQKIIIRVSGKIPVKKR